MKGVPPRVIQLAAIPIAISAMMLAFPPHPLAAAEIPDEPLPKSFNDEWCAYRTAHFELRTDLGHRQALRTIGGLNRFRRLFLALFPDASGNASLPVTMLVFRRVRDFAEATGATRYAGVTLPSMREYRLLAARGQLGAPTENVWHEYAHYLLRTRTGHNYPLWYEEGLATYLGAADLNRDRVRLGKLPHRPLQRAAHDDSVSFQAVIGATSVTGLDSAELLSFYGKAWLLTHFIRHGHEAGYPDWRPALARYVSGAERDFDAAFGQSPTQAGELLKQYLDRRRLPGATLDLPRAETPSPTRRCLSAAERDYELALSITPLNRPVAIRALEAMAHDALRLTALARAVWDDDERARNLVDRALALAPADPEANVLFAHLLVRGCEFSSASECIGRWARAAERYRRVLEGNPERYDAAYGLGVAYLHTGRAANAMAHLRLAYDKMPWDASVNFYLGEGYRLAGDPRATVHLRNARNWAADADWRRRAEFALQRLRDGG